MAAGDVILTNVTLTASDMTTLVAQLLSAIAAKQKDPSEFEVADSLTNITSLPVFHQAGTVLTLKRVLVSLLQGKSASFQVSGGYIQWQLDGAASWTNLIAIADLKGDAGTNGQIFTGTAVTGTGSGISAVVDGSKAGDIYMNTTTLDYYQASAAGVWTWIRNIKPADGTNGEIFTGTAVTGTGSGIAATVEGSKTGDIYMNTTTLDMYQASAASVWTWIRNIKPKDGVDGKSYYTYFGTAVTGTGTAISATVDGSQVGDMYVNTDTCNIYQQTAAGVWAYRYNNKGTAGSGAGNVVVPVTGLLASKVYLFQPNADGSAEGSFVEFKLSDYFTTGYEMLQVKTE